MDRKHLVRVRERSSFGLKYSSLARSLAGLGILSRHDPSCSTRRGYSRRRDVLLCFQIHTRDNQLEIRFPFNTTNMEFDGSILIQCPSDEKHATETKHKLQMTLHCQRCNTVLGDSFDVCGEIKSMDSIMCYKVTNDVVVGDAMESKHKGEMVNCIYSPLKCRSCRSAVGKVIHSAPPRLAMVRSIFLLYKANISCYILNSGSMVKASTLTFDLKTFRESINEVRQQFEAQLNHMLIAKSRLADRSGI